MKLLLSSKIAEFAAKAFSAAGLDLEAARSAGKVSVIADTVAAAKKPGKTEEEYEAALKEANAENDAIVEALSKVGLPVDAALLDASGHVDAEKFSAAFEKAVAKRAVDKIARAGHEPIPENVKADPTKASAKASKTMAEFRAMKPGDQAKFCAEVRAGKATLTE